MGNDSITRYCLDSNAVTDILRKRQEVLQHLNSALQIGCDIFIPSIAYYELVRGFKAAESFHKVEGVLFVL